MTQPPASETTTPERSPEQARPTPRWFLVTYAVLILVLVEVLSYVAARVLQSKWGMYQDPVPVAGHVDYEEYLRIRDPVLGWPSRDEFGDRYAEDGSRWCRESGVSPSAPWAVSLYGDSFTADWPGGDTAHWGCRLQKALRTVVKNFGVGGYGTDQALIRYEQNTGDAAPVVILGHQSASIMRNLTRYRDFQNFSRRYAFKPRFDIDQNGEIELIPIPKLSPDEYVRFLGIQSPQLVLEHELFHPGGPTGAVRLTLPYSVAILRNLAFYGLQSRIRRDPFEATLYEPDHAFHGLQVTLKIMLRFAEAARRRGQQPMLIVFPDRIDLEHFRAERRWYYQPLLDGLRKANCEVVNFGERLEKHLSGRPVTDAFGKGSREGEAHYNQEISQVIAETVAGILRAQVTLPAQPVAPPAGAE